MSSYAELRELIATADAMPYSKAASQIWAQAVLLAEDLEVTEDLVYALLQLQTSYHAGDEITRTVAPFMRTRELYRSHPEAFDDRAKHSLAWCYRYAIGAMRSVPEVPIAAIAGYLDEAHELYQQLGDSRRALFQIDYGMALLCSDRAAAEAAHTNWVNAEQTDLANCAACDPEFEVEYLFEAGRSEEAVRVGEESLQDDAVTCASQPHSLLSCLLGPYIATGRIDAAWSAHLRAIRRIESASGMPADITTNIRGLVGMAQHGRPECAARALELFQKYLPWWEEAESPRHLYDLATTGAMACASVPPETVLPVTLPGAQLPWQQADTLENPTAAQAYHWAQGIALLLAQRFDARPGLPQPYAVARLERDLAGLTVPAPTWEVVDVTGLVLTAADAAGVDPGAHDDDYPSLSEYLTEMRQRADVLTASVNCWGPARELLGRGEVLAAAEYVDKQLRLDPASWADPVGVRVTGLELLGQAALKAGYPEEAMKSFRDSINVAAAAGMYLSQAQVAAQLGEVLCKRRRFAEAGNVLHAALAAVEPLAASAAADSAAAASGGAARDSLVREVLHAIRVVYIKVLDQEEDHYAAGLQRQLLAQHYADINLPTDADPATDADANADARASLLMEAALNFRSAFRFAEADTVHAEIIRLADAGSDPAWRVHARRQAAWTLSVRPGGIVDSVAAHIQELNREGRDIITAHPGDFDNPQEAIAGMWGGEHRQMRYGLRHDLAIGPLEQCVAVYTAAGLLDDVAEEYLDSAVQILQSWAEFQTLESSLPADLRAARIPTLTEVKAWIDAAQETLDAQPAPARQRVLQLQGVRELYAVIAREDTGQ